MLFMHRCSSHSAGQHIENKIMVKKQTPQKRLLYQSIDRFQRQHGHKQRDHGEDNESEHRALYQPKQSTVQRVIIF